MNLTDTLSYPKWVEIQLLEACNLRCRMCYEWGESGSYHGKKNTASLDYSIVQKVINDCLPGKPWFEFFGGEPLLYPEVSDVIRLIKDGGCSLDMPTNGLLVEKYAELLVETKLDRLWISLDGPEEINDQQRGQGVFQQVIRGIEKLHEIRTTRKSESPKVCISYTVTPLNHSCIENLFLNCLDLSKIDIIIFTFQAYATQQSYKRYVDVLKTVFGVPAAPCARGIVREPAEFKNMDFEAVARQMKKVRKICREQGIHFIAFPKTIEPGNIRNYFTARREEMIDKRTRCAFPWVFVEISAQGIVTVCHSFYDLSLGNVYEESIIDIWRGDRLKKVRNYLRKRTFPICTACCLYYTDPNSYKGEHI